MTPPELVWSTISLLLLAASFPFYLYGAWIILDAETVSWARLTRHLRYVFVGLVLTTVPILGWMLPRFVETFGRSGLVALHAIVGLQAYAMLAVALTGIVRIYQAKRAHDLYRNPDQDIDLDDIHENMGSWRRRLRVGVFGYVILWVVSFLLGLSHYLSLYWF